MFCKLEGCRLGFERSLQTQFAWIWMKRFFHGTLEDGLNVQARQCLVPKGGRQLWEVSRIAVCSSGTLGKGRKLRFTVYGGFLSRLFFALVLKLLCNCFSL
jgi:hypothetical protein